MWQQFCWLEWGSAHPGLFKTFPHMLQLHRFSGLLTETVACPDLTSTWGRGSALIAIAIEELQRSHSSYRNSFDLLIWGHPKTTISHNKISVTRVPEERWICGSAALTRVHDPPQTCRLCTNLSPMATVIISWPFLLSKHDAQSFIQAALRNPHTCTILTQD